MNNGLRFIRELFGSWWARSWVALAAVSTLTTFIPLYVHGFTLPRWILLVVSLVAWILAPFDLYRKKVSEIDRLRAAVDAIPVRRACLVIHPQPGSRFYRQIDQSRSVVGVYIEVCLVIENTGTRNSVINRYDLLIRESGQRYSRLHPEPRGSIQSVRALHAGLRRDILPSGDIIRVPPEDAAGPGIIPLWIGGNVPDQPHLACTLILTDSESNSATSDFSIAEAQ